MKSVKNKDYTKSTIVLCFIMIMVTLGLCSSGRNMYLTAITEALNIKRGAFAVESTFRYVTTAVLNVYFGNMVQRFGTKKLIIAGFICLIIFAVLNVVATSLWVFYLSNIFLGIGLSWAATTMAGTIINRTCKKNKGVITGLVLAANGIGGAAAVQIISPIIFEQGNPFGYRNSYIMVASVLLVVMIIFMIFYHEHLKNPLSENVKKTPAKTAEYWIGMDFKEMTKKPYFYVMVICIFLTGGILQGTNNIALPHMYDTGLKVEYVAILTSLGSVMLTLAKFMNGFTVDRCGTKIAMNICYGCMVLSMFALMLISNTSVGRVMAFARSILEAFALPLQTVMLSIFANELFGSRSFEKTLGIFAAANYAGQAILVPFGNIVYDILGSYNLSFVIYGITSIFIFIAMQYVIFKATRDKKRSLQQQSVA